MGYFDLSCFAAGVFLAYHEGWSYDWDFARGFKNDLLYDLIEFGQARIMEIRNLKGGISQGKVVPVAQRLSTVEWQVGTTTWRMVSEPKTEEEGQEFCRLLRAEIKASHGLEDVVTVGDQPLLVGKSL